MTITEINIEDMNLSIHFEHEGCDIGVYINEEYRHLDYMDFRIPVLRAYEVYSETGQTSFASKIDDAADWTIYVSPKQS